MGTKSKMQIVLGFVGEKGYNSCATPQESVLKHDYKEEKGTEDDHSVARIV